ncbi:YciI family protein [Jiangella rhizosphaerae]|uniref:YCII-related domain-containing protein n=1 Tax=Jiangella rhizosphaerae TaxID=2293569 RepID=A0A418KPJ4_9ACTN|nr:hypothetical protein [Jiangella rhizosphaerae]RIQ21159.1 hypothetical protein DY240_15890 [Jiangella rhizosphaerae]
MDDGAAHEPEEWVVLLHTPGPGVDGPIFGDPRFAHHRAFLQSMAERGWLVAAGPFGDAGAEGMTVLRVRGPGAAAEAKRLAEADQSVTQGLLTVRVRPWRVVSQAEPATS